METLSRPGLAGQVEVLLARAETSRADVEQLCAQARARAILGLCLNTSRLELAASLLEESPIKLTGLVGFPLGAADADTKRFEAETAIDLGASEIEVVANLGRLKDQDHRYILRELRDVVEAADERPVKVVFEWSLLSPEEKRIACEVMLDSGAQFLCTGTGLLPSPTVGEIADLRTMLGPKTGVKAAGIVSSPMAQALLDAGATRLGTSDLPGLLGGTN
jgi:deoxyribose-phosphate aldolase